MLPIVHLILKLTINHPLIYTFCQKHSSCIFASGKNGSNPIVYYGRICSNFYLICAIIFFKNEMNYCKFLRVKKIKRHLEQQEQGDGFIYNIEIRDGNATNFRAAYAFGFSLRIRQKKIGLIRGFAFLDFLRIPHFRIRIFKGFYKIIRKFVYL